MLFLRLGQIKVADMMSATTKIAIWGLRPKDTKAEVAGVHHLHGHACAPSEFIGHSMSQLHLIIQPAWRKSGPSFSIWPLVGGNQSQRETKWTDSIDWFTVSSVNLRIDIYIYLFFGKIFIWYTFLYLYYFTYLDYLDIYIYIYTFIWIYCVQKLTNIHI